MEAATTDRTSTIDTSVELCKECREKVILNEKYPLSGKGRKICEIIDELKEFINESVEDVWETNSTLAHSYYQCDKCYNIGFQKHGILSKEGRFALKKDSDMFHTFKVLSLPGCLPISATLYISGGDNTVYTPIKTVKVDYTGTFCFFNCPFPVSFFPFENYSVGLIYELTNNSGFQMIKDITIECINTKNHISIRDKIWEKMKEKDIMYKK